MRAARGRCQTLSRQDLAVGLPGTALAGGTGHKSALGEAEQVWEDHLVAWGKGVFLLSLQGASLSQGSSASPSCPGQQREQKEPLGRLKGCRGFWIQHGITSICSSSASCASPAWWQVLHRCHPCSRARLSSLLTGQ